MHTPREAVAEILGRIAELGEPETAPLARADGRVLARAIVSDIDLPPFEKSAVDGYAVHAADFADASGSAPERTLALVGESRAGEPFRGAVARGACVAIFTGAELPPDCDAVVMVEQSAARGGEVALRDRPRAGQHVCHRGQDLREGAVVLEPGRRMGPAEIAVLASVGCDPVPVRRRPRAAVVTTGDELVAPAQRPGPGQIREGNTLQLAAMLARFGAEVENLGVVRDEPAALERRLADALRRCDLLVTTGGVSVGKYDLVGAALEKIGVQPVLHRIAMKPGKPLWFGMHGRVPVFALPGNPVSCFVGCELFVRPALARLEGASAEPDADPLRARVRRGRWVGETVEPNPREQYVPATARAGADGVEELAPVRWTGSADVVGLARADALAVIPIDTRLEPRTLVDYRRLR